MNTIDGLKALPSIIEKLLNDRDAIQLQIDECYKPFRDIIQEVLVVKIHDNFVYIDDIDIGVGDKNVCFALRYNSDDECEGTYSYPIEAFVSADTLWEYITEQNMQKAKAEIAKKEHNERMAKKALEEAERETYEKLKKKFEQPLHEKLGMDSRDLHYKGT